MCYINGVRVSYKTFLAYKKQQKELKHLQGLLFQPAVKGFDFGKWPVIKPAATGPDWDIVAMTWGFIPDYIKDAAALERLRKGYKNAAGIFVASKPMLNIRGDEMLSNPLYRSAAYSRRCLVLSSGFYDHRHIYKVGKNGKSLTATKKIPYHISVRDKEHFFIAGLYNTWTDKETGETFDSFAILTTDATQHEMMSIIHNSKRRMPVIFTDELAEEWTNPDLTEIRIQELASFQFPPELMYADIIDPDFLNVPEPWRPADTHASPTLFS